VNLSRSSTQTRFDVVIVGGGHNGLTCACYLAKSGLRVGVFERRSILGGAAVTEEFHPGFRNSTASYTVSLLNPKSSATCASPSMASRCSSARCRIFCRCPTAAHSPPGPALADTVAAINNFSKRDAERLPEYYKMLDAAVALLRSQLLETPPADPRRLRDLWGALKMGRKFRKLAVSTQRDIHELFTRSAGDLLDHWFETDAVKALFGFDAVVGNYASPYTPGSAYVLLHHVFGEVNGKSGVWGHAVGGMGAITQAMAAEARRLGVILETDAPVKRILVERGRATGIELEDGRVVEGDAIAANLGPKPLFLDLLADAELPAEFRARIERLRVGSATFRMNVALSELPKFTAAPRGDGGAHLGSGIIFAPSLEYMDHAFADARLTGMSRRPIVEMLIPRHLTARSPKGSPCCLVVLSAFLLQIAGRP
jgi:phytoene dehydrogenase-like protein